MRIYSCWSWFWHNIWDRNTKHRRWQKDKLWFQNWPIVLIMQVIPSQKQYVANFFDELRASMNTRTGESQQEMMMDSHRRNREHGESKLKFQVRARSHWRNCEHGESKPKFQVRVYSHSTKLRTQTIQLQVRANSQRWIWEHGENKVKCQVRVYLPRLNC